jgi:hypothetical protein
VTCSTGAPSSATTALETTTTVPETISKDAREKAIQTVKPAAIKSSLQLLDILDMPGSGSEGYDHYYIGNKSALVGPDLQGNTPDDAAYQNFPEIYTRFDPTDGEVFVQTAEQDDETQQFWTTTISFRVAPDNQLFDKPEQLSTGDIRQAILDPSTTFVSASAEVASNGALDEGGLSFSGEQITTGLGMGTVGDRIISDDHTLTNQATSLVDTLGASYRHFSTAGTA